MNNNLNFKFNSLQWEYKNTHLVMPARRVFGGPDPIYDPIYKLTERTIPFMRNCPQSLWRTDTKFLVNNLIPELHKLRQNLHAGPQARKERLFLRGGVFFP